jgi:hypothetical protein
MTGRSASRQKHSQAPTTPSVPTMMSASSIAERQSPRPYIGAHFPGHEAGRGAVHRYRSLGEAE